MSEEVGRRDYLKLLGTLIGGLIIGAAVGYLAKPPAPAEIITKTVEKTVTKTVTAPAPTPTPTPTPKPGVRIHVTMVAEPKPIELKKFIPEFEAKTGIGVDFEVLPYPTLEEKQMIELSGARGTIDVVHVDCVWVGRYAGMGWTIPVDDYIARTPPDESGGANDVKDWVPRELAELGMWEGKTYGFPFIVATQVIWYRTDIFDEYGLTPEDIQTWDQVYDVAKRLTDELKDTGVYGITFMGKRGVQAMCNFYNFIDCFGGRVYDPVTYKPEINSPAVLKGLDTLCKLKTVALPGVEGFDYDENVSVFAEGKAALSLMWSHTYPAYQDPAKSKIVDKSFPTLIPGVKQPDGTIRRSATTGGWSIEIPKDSKHKDEAWQFITWATSKEMDKRLAYAQDPCRYSALRDPELMAKYIHYPVFLETLEKAAVGRPRIPPWPEMSDAMGKEVNAALSGLKTPKEALDDLQTAYEDILKRSGYWKP